MSVLKQDHFQYEEEEVLNVVLMGNKKVMGYHGRKKCYLC